MSALLEAEEAFGSALPVVAGALAVAGAAVAVLPARVTARRELRRAWATSLVAALLFFAALYPVDSPGPLLLPTVLGLIAVAEYAAVLRLGQGERVVLGVAAVLVPPLAYVAHVLPEDVRVGLRLPVLVLIACVLAAVLSGDPARAAERAARTVFGVLWIPLALSGLLVLEGTAIAVVVAVAFGDLAAWCGGAALARLGGGLALPLSRLSPDRTWAHVLAAGMGVAVGLGAVGGFTVTLWAAVLCGCVVGGLLGSALTREAGAKGTGTWLPGFGGLLDRLGSLLSALPLAMLVVL
ncbi:phosphatidate cytidylyltransferase [Streptomyces syringium]|uniref:phosphatidate cytidylyltransferase n=1 Tax=Streptomyces syringium TaxID=76729 RepID=UPI0033C83048